MAQTSWDVIIVGQGLAGTTLAWHLQEAGQQVLIIDADEPVTSSKIAAGLITPITGMRMVLSWQYDKFLPVARDFYQSIEQRTGRHFFSERTAIRLFKSDEEQANWAKRGQRLDYQAHLVAPAPTPLLDANLADARKGGFAMHAAQLDVAAYLEASRTALECQQMTLNWLKDITVKPDGVSVGDLQASLLVSCEGYAATANPFFSWVPFIAAKGDILTVRFHAPVPPISLHRGIWIAPTIDSEIFRIGSTYDWENLDQVPNTAARDDIERRLKEFFQVPYTILDHKAAVRPIIKESKAYIGLHPKHEQLGFFNGLGSKGSLHAPWYAQQFSDFIVRHTPIPEEMNVGKHFAQ
ncbi:MAG: FAD-dependent oxidoreductase [Rhizobiales bacterium]|nr:FAD-dependent oxidoreductase [Hyphomicrobiales bacterium]